MHHRLLLGSTALVGASLLFTSAAMAQDGGLEVILGGFTEFGGTAASKDTLNDGKNRNYAFYNDNEIFVRVNGLTDGGIRYGSKIEIEAGGEPAGDISIDEAGLFFSGNFGRVELGRDDGAEDIMFVGAEDAQAGTGGLDGDTANLGRIQLVDTADSIKATYFTPRIAGFQLGGSWIPDGDDNANGRGSNAFVVGSDNRENLAGLGGNWVGVLGPVDLTLSAVGLLGDVNGGNQIQSDNGFKDDQRAWAVGGLLGFGGLSFGASFNDNKGPTDDQEFKLLSFGLAYGFGPANVSAGYEHDWNENSDNADIFVVSGDVGLLPGVTLKGDVMYNTEDPGANESGNSSSTYAGVLTVQLDY